MLEKNLEDEYQEEIDLDNLDYTLDEDDVEGDEGDEGDKSSKKKDDDEQEEEDLTAKELAAVRAEVEALKTEKAAIEKEREEAYEAAEQSRTTAINGAIQQFQNEIAREQKEILELQKQYNRATSEQDVDKQNLLMDKYNEKQQILAQLNGNINNAQSQLANKPVRKTSTATSTQKKLTPADEMANKWVAENSWYNDPAHMDKRKIVDDLCDKAIKAKYDPSSLKFWNYIDKEVEKLTTKSATPRRSPPAVRPAIKQGSSQSVGNKQKVDADILRTAINMLGRFGFYKGSDEYNKRIESFYASVKNNMEREKKNG